MTDIPTTTPPLYATSSGWRDRATLRALDTARITRDEPTSEQLDTLVAEAKPTDEAGYRAAVTAAAREVIEAQAAGNRGDARQAVMGFADTIDVDHGAADARADQAAAAKAAQHREREAALDPETLAAAVAGHDFRTSR